MRNLMANRMKLAPIVGTLTLIGLVACGGAADHNAESATAAAAPECTTPSDSIVANALETFVSTRPVTAMRFLYPIGTDSALPEAAMHPLQGNGRVLYVWPADPATQAKATADHRARGRSAMLIVSYHGTADEPDGKKAVTFSGLYIDQVNNGMAVPRTKIVFDCAAPEGSRYKASDASPPAADTGKAAGG